MAQRMIEIAKRRQETEETLPWKRQRLDELWAHNKISDNSLLEYAQNAGDVQHLWNKEISDSSSLLQITEETNGQTIDALFELSLKSRFGNAASMTTYNIQLKPDMKISYYDIDKSLEAVFDKAIKHARLLNTSARGKVVLETWLEPLEPVIIPQQDYNKLTGRKIIDTVSHILSSHQQISLDSGDFTTAIGVLC